MYYLYGFKDIKSKAVSNCFVTAEPFEKVKQNVAVSLLQLSIREPTNPFVLFSSDYDLVCLQTFADDQEPLDNDWSSVCLSELLAASRRAYEMRTNQTSPTEEFDKTEE